MARPALKRPVVEYIRDHYGLPRRRACRLVGLHRSVFYYRSVKNPRLELRGRMRELARARVRYGYRRLHVLLKREGWSLGRNLAYRLYCEEGLQLRSKLTWSSASLYPGSSNTKTISGSSELFAEPAFS